MANPISKNQYDFLTNMSKGRTETGAAATAGKMSWAKQQLANSTYKPVAPQTSAVPTAAVAQKTATPFSTATVQGASVNTRTIGSPGPTSSTFGARPTTPAAYGVIPVRGLTDTQRKAQNWINTSGRHGGLAAYTQKNYEKLRNGEITYDALKADAERVGYGMPNDIARAAEVPAEPDYSWITDQVNNELATQKATIEQELARLKQESELAVNQNNTFLQDQMKNLEENRVTVGNEIVNFQNRRGGFYSGGVDFQTAHNNDAYAASEGSVTKDIAARNADIWGRNNLLAQQASENLAKLTAQAPDRIRQLIEEQKAKDAAAATEQAKVSGYDASGNPTMEMSKQLFNQNLDLQQFQLKNTETMANLTGRLPDGTPTTDYQQQILKNAWDVITNIGVVPPELAHIVGVPAGTKTQDAIKVAIQQQNANTSAQNASNRGSGSSASSSDKLSGKESINNFYNMQNDFIDSQASKNEALHVLGQNKDHLSSTDYRNLLNWINKNLK